MLEVGKEISKEEIEEERKRKKESTYRIALYLSEIFLKSGGETYKVEGMTYELCKSQGFPNANIYVTPTFIVIGDDRADGITFVKSIKDRSLNLKKISLVTNYYEELLKKETLDPKRVIKTLKKIERFQEYTEMQKIMYAGVGSTAFGALFHVGINEAIATFLITISATYFSGKLGKVFKAWILGVIIACFYIGLTAFALSQKGMVSSSHKIIIGAILPFLPGVAITKSITDLVHGDYIAGTSRAIEAFLAALSIGIGIGLAMNFWVEIGGKI